MPLEIDEARLPPAERQRMYSARELVDLALAGHFCVRESIGQGIRYVYRTRRAIGRQMMNELGSLRAYASEEEIDQWQDALLRLVDQIKREESQRPNEADRAQLKMFE